ncbi:MAG TPA: hypothetical protein VHF86_05450 [Xanthomonadaceae bacterium]|nr:hypothetical protein [Xanthomonadaceae bacterium]
MSVDTRLNPNLPSLDALNALDRAGLEGRQPQLDGGTGVQGLAETGLGEPLHVPAVDDGERILAAPAWDEDAPRMLSAGDFQLGGSDRSQDLDAGVEAMVAPLG